MMRKLASVLTGIVLLSACTMPASDGEVYESAPSVEESGESVKASPPFYGDPANNAVFAIDVSHWEGPLAQAEMDCFWDSGVRHIVAGTQVEEVTRQQLAMAIARGLTVDAYVYLYWDESMTAQVKEAFKRTSGFPIGRMWLDVEQDPAGLGWEELEKMVQEALNACHAQGTADCGIYTGPGFWKSYMDNTLSFSQEPLWYAIYNSRTSLNNWSTESFGGWTKPVAKQWAEQVLCGVGVDKDTMQVITQPTVVVDRKLPPDTKLPPPAPTGVYPANGSVVGLDYLKLMSNLIPRATQYQLALEFWTGTAFKPYYTWNSTDAFRKVSPSMKNTIYRVRARARNVYGWGEWSAYSTFDYGLYKGPRPEPDPNNPTPPVDAGTTPDPTPAADAGTTPDPTPAADAGTTPDPSPTPEAGTTPTPGAPGGLAPDGVTLSSASVTLTCTEVQGATKYEFTIENLSSGKYVTYTKYTPSKASQTFYPQVHNTTYRWRVRAQVNGVWGPASANATFQYK